MCRLRLVLLIAAVALLAPAAAQAAPLKAGAAVADITPANGGTTLGFVRPDITVKGVHTRLTGRALVLDDGDTKVALLSTDLGYALEKDDLVAKLKDLGYTHETILYSGTHTHSGPGSLAPWQVAQLAKAIRTADGRRERVKAGWATGRVLDANQQRSIEAHNANHGLDQTYGSGQNTDDPDGEEHTRDTVLRTLRVERLDGTPLAAWTEFPVHPTTSTPAVDIWDADLAGAANFHLERGKSQIPKRDRGDFVALWSNGAAGDMMPRFDAYNPTATMDLLGQRIAREARAVWKRAGKTLTSDMPIDVRWTRTCYCGQQVEPGKFVSAKPFFGLPFLGGSEDGASIFKEPVQTEGRRLPADASDPVQGRKLIVPAPTDAAGIHESTPEFQVIRVGSRLLVAAPGEPSVQMGRRLVSAVETELPKGVEDVVIVGLANDYLGYLTTPEEYQAQHYEGGHTVFGLWTSLLARNTLVELTKAMAVGAPAPTPDKPAELGDAASAPPAVGDGGVAGKLLAAPTGTVERGEVVDLRWSGAPGGVDRPADVPFLSLERRDKGGEFRRVDSDLGLSFTWRETSEGQYAARYDVAPDLAPGTHRVRVTSGAYDLKGEAFQIVASRGLIARGVLQSRPKRRTKLVLRAQFPPPDAARAVTYRALSPTGGRATLLLGKRKLRAVYVEREGGWRVVLKQRVRDGTKITLPAGGLRDGAGNRTGKAQVLVVGRLAEAKYPRTMGVGGGRTPGVGGSGTFPP